MYVVEIVGAQPGSEWDHPPWSDPDMTTALKYLVSLTKLLEADASAPKLLRFSGTGFSSDPINLAEAYSYDYLFSEEP